MLSYIFLFIYFTNVSPAEIPCPCGAAAQLYTYVPRGATRELRQEMAKARREDEQPVNLYERLKLQDAGKGGEKAAKKKGRKGGPRATHS